MEKENDRLSNLPFAERLWETYSFERWVEGEGPKRSIDELEFYKAIEVVVQEKDELIKELRDFILKVEYEFI